MCSFLRYLPVIAISTILSSCSSGLYLKKFDLQPGAYIDKTAQDIQVVISCIDSLNTPTDGRNKHAYFMSVVNNSSDRIALAKEDVALDIGNSGISAFLWDWQKYVHEISLLKGVSAFGGSDSLAEAFGKEYSTKGFPFGAIEPNSRSEGYIAFAFDYGQIQEDKLAQLKQQRDAGKDISSSTIIAKLSTNTGNVLVELPIKVIYQ